MAKSDRIHHILVIRLSAMGDVAMTVPVLNALYKKYPQLQITILTRGFFGPIFWGIPNVQVFEAKVEGRHRGLRGLRRLYLELRDLDIDAVADLHNVLRSNILKYFFKMDGIPFVQINKGRKEKQRLTRANNKVFRPLKTTHARYADVFSGLGFPVEVPTTATLPSRELSPQVYERIGQKTKKWIGVAPFAAFHAKEYPLDSLREVLRKLDSTKKHQIMLFGGGPREIQILDSLSKNFESCVNVADKLSFKDQLVLISHLDLMLSMDSGNGHLAAMFGVPVITLWGVTHPYAGFAPFGQGEEKFLMANRDQYPKIPTSVYGNRCPKGYEEAIGSIGPGEIVQKINGLLREEG